MDRKHYNIILYAVIAVIFIYFIAFRFFNTSIERELKVQMDKGMKESDLQEMQLTRQEELKEEKKISEANELTPYTIKVQKESALSENQYYWDSNTSAILEGTDVMQRMEEEGAFDGNKKTSEQFQRQIDLIDGRIHEYERKVQNDPGDDEARQKLQSLYMLRSTVGGMEEAVVEK